MKQKYLLVPAILLAFVLVGAGCAGQTNQDDSNNSVQEQMEQDVEDAENDEGNSEENQEETSESESDISLSAEARGEGQVYFEWSIPENMNPERFVIIRDEKVDPVHNQKNYWFRQPGSRRSVTWVNIPSGNYHFRICIIENGECSEYSNDVQVEVE